MAGLALLLQQHHWVRSAVATTTLVVEEVEVGSRPCRRHQLIRQRHQMREDKLVAPVGEVVAVVAMLVPTTASEVLVLVPEVTAGEEVGAAVVMVLQTVW